MKKLAKENQFIKEKNNRYKGVKNMKVAPSILSANFATFRRRRLKKVEQLRGRLDSYRCNGWSIRS